MNHIIYFIQYFIQIVVIIQFYSNCLNITKYFLCRIRVVKKIDRFICILNKIITSNILYLY